MPRSRTDMHLLRQEARAIELLAEQTEVAPADLQRYWDLSAELITLSASIDELATARPQADFEDPEVLDLRRHLRRIAADLASIAED